jgi:hypothetical protein
VKSTVEAAAGNRVRLIVVQPDLSLRVVAVPEGCQRRGCAVDVNQIGIAATRYRDRVGFSRNECIVDVAQRRLLRVREIERVPITVVTVNVKSVSTKGGPVEFLSRAIARRAPLTRVK